jgi:hypothetical protein
MFKKTPEFFLLFFIGCKSSDNNVKSSILLRFFVRKMSVDERQSKLLGNPFCNKSTNGPFYNPNIWLFLQ